MSQTDEYSVTVQPDVKSTYMTVSEAPPSSVRVGESFAFAGYLYDEDGHILSGKTINGYSDGNLAGSTTTNANGWWSFTIAPEIEGTFTLYAEFPGDADYTGCP